MKDRSSSSLIFTVNVVVEVNLSDVFLARSILRTQVSELILYHNIRIMYNRNYISCFSQFNKKKISRSKRLVILFNSVSLITRVYPYFARYFPCTFDSIVQAIRTHTLIQRDTIGARNTIPILRIILARTLLSLDYRTSRNEAMTGIDSE